MDTIEMLWNDFKAAVEILPKPYLEYTEYNYVFTNLSKNLKKEANGK